jgi:hypothetical protein
VPSDDETKCVIRLALSYCCNYAGKDSETGIVSPDLSLRNERELGLGTGETPP